MKLIPQERFAQQALNCRLLVIDEQMIPTQQANTSWNNVELQRWKDIRFCKNECKNIALFQHWNMNDGFLTLFQRWDITLFRVMLKANCTPTTSIRFVFHFEYDRKSRCFPCRVAPEFVLWVYLQHENVLHKCCPLNICGLVFIINK